jgi:fumarylacetoacetase
MNPVVDETHDPRLRCWVSNAAGHPEFPIQNLPLGRFSPGGGAPRAGTAIGDSILDLGAILSLLPQKAAAALSEGYLNATLALPVEERVALRRCLSSLLSDEKHKSTLTPHLYDSGACDLQMPVTVGNYTDFYTGIHHATNVGRLFRPDNPLLPNYKYVPIAYHGRASSVRASGTDVFRPLGQRRKAPSDSVPEFGPARRVDYEVELGVWIGAGNQLSQPIPIGEARAHIAGMSLLNDWSARDLQEWEYQPLGPFLSKSFLTSVSPWIVTAEALAPFRIAPAPRPAGDPQPLPYLSDSADGESGAYSITLGAALSSAQMRSKQMPAITLSTSSAEHMYWTVAQMVTHHASNGCNLQPGDLLGTGTLSGPNENQRGSLIEITSGGKAPITLPSGETRTFLEDGDEVTLTGYATADGFARIGFGACRGVIRGAAT